MVTEEELREQGYKKIISRFDGICSFCSKRYEKGEDIYWMKDRTTSVCCQRCYEPAKTKRTVRCPSCGTEFEA
jgi:transposase